MAQNLLVDVESLSALLDANKREMSQLEENSLQADIQSEAGMADKNVMEQKGM